MRYVISTTIGLFVAFASVACGGGDDCSQTRTCVTSNESAGGSPGAGGSTASGGVGAGGFGYGAAPASGGSGTSIYCNNSTECDDGIACNGYEFCTVSHHCASGDPIQCGAPDHCQSTCEERGGGQFECVVTAADADGDGHGDLLCDSDPGDDCDDESPETYPGAAEVCDGKDNDCDGKDDLSDGFSLSGSVKTLEVGSTAPAYEPSIAWVPGWSRYALAWTDERDGKPQIYFARIFADGSLETTPLRISSGSTGLAKHPRVVANGAEVVVFWDDSRTNGDQIYAQRIDSLGNPTGLNAQLTNQYGSIARYPSPVRFGQGWAVSFTFKSATGTATRVRTFDDAFQLESEMTPGASLGGFTWTSGLATLEGQLAVGWDVTTPGTAFPSQIRWSQGQPPLSTVQTLTQLPAPPFSAASGPVVGAYADRFVLAYRYEDPAEIRIRYRDGSITTAASCLDLELHGLEADISPQAIGSYPGGALLAFASRDNVTDAGAVRLARISDCQLIDEIQVADADINPLTHSVDMAQSDAGTAVVWTRGQGANRLLQTRTFGPNFCD
jgi:hypothetical protein